jgi:BASS family bile acid:Na+ symporter
MALLVETVIPAGVVLLMFVVGLELTPNDFRRVALVPRTALTATLGQLLLLPAVAAIMTWSLRPPDHVIAGMVLIAACPGGAMANLYTYLAGANTALSVTLTAIGTLIAAVGLPLISSAGLTLLTDGPARVHVPIPRIVGELLLVMVLPIGIGMLIRAWKPEWIRDHGSSLRRLSIVVLAVVLALAIRTQPASALGQIGSLLPAVVTFIFLAMMAGVATGAVLALGADDRFTLLADFATRNLAIAAFVAVSVLGRSEFLLFGTVFFVVEGLVVVSLALLFRFAKRRGVVLVRGES